MVTINNHGQFFNGALNLSVDVYCKRTDTKPTAGIPNGASCTEIDINGTISAVRITW